jgi:hypothetical protein
MYVTYSAEPPSIAQINMSNGSINMNWNILNNNLQGINEGLAIDSTGTYMYFVTSFGSIAKIQVSNSQIISTWTIPFPSATPCTATGIVIDNTETYIYVTFNTGSYGNGNIAQINMSTGAVNTNWLTTNISFTYPTSLVIDSAGTYMYVCYYNMNTTNSTVTFTGYIAQINMSNGTINKGNWITLPNIQPLGLAIDNTGTYMYVTNNGLSTISQIDISTASISVSNWVTEPSGSFPGFLTIYNNYLYVSNQGSSGGIGNICKYELTNTSSSTVTGTSYEGESSYNFVTPDGTYVIEYRFSQTKDNTITNFINIFKIIVGFKIFIKYVEISIKLSNKDIDNLIRENTLRNFRNNTNSEYIAKFYKRVSNKILQMLPKYKRGYCNLESIKP